MEACEQPGHNHENLDEDPVCIYMSHLPCVRAVPCEWVQDLNLGPALPVTQLAELWFPCLQVGEYVHFHHDDYHSVCPSLRL